MAAAKFLECHPPPVLPGLTKVLKKAEGGADEWEKFDKAVEDFNSAAKRADLGGSISEGKWATKTGSFGGLRCAQVPVATLFSVSRFFCAQL